MSATEGNQGPQMQRHGQQGFSRSKFFGGEFDADQALPTNKRQGIKLERFTECQWYIDMPSWVTGYDVHFLRWIEVFNDDGDELFGKWTEDETVSETESLTYYQFVNGQRIAAYIDNIAGAPDGVNFLRIITTGTNKGV